MRTSVPLLIAPLFALPLGAQQIEDPGPHLVGIQDEVFPGSTGSLDGRVYYPALTSGLGAAPDPGGGPYPLVGFMHGWPVQPEEYDELATHIASWGFIVASIATQNGPLATMQLEAQDTADMLAWLDGASGDPLGFYAGMVSDDEWSAAGHSMGGGALFYLIEDEPRVRTVVAMQPWKGQALGGAAGGSANLSTWTGDVLILAGSVDMAVPVSTMTLPYYQLCKQTARAAHVTVLGMGHMGPTDSPEVTEPMAASEQQRMHRRFVTGFLRAEVQGAEELYVDLLGEGATSEPVLLDARAAEPVHWSASSDLAPATSAVGVAGVAGDLAVAAASLAPAALPTAYGLLGLDLGQSAVLLQGLVPGNGLVEVLVPTPPGFAGTTVYTQGFVLGPDHGGFTVVAQLALP